MVKLTKFQIETKLATMVINNDHEQLGLFIGENSDADINGIVSKKQFGLLSLAIQNRCKECFDWLIANPNYTAIGNKPDDDFDFADSNFYFLNQEFGDYNLENYKKFCKFINESSDEVLLDFYNNTSLKSKNNKTLLYDYLYSYKEKEINLLINE